jgi:hypothetical protein
MRMVAYPLIERDHLVKDAFYFYLIYIGPSTEQ